MPHYTPLTPVEPPVPTSSVCGKVAINHFQGYENLCPSRKFGRGATQIRPWSSTSECDIHGHPPFPRPLREGPTTTSVGLTQPPLNTTANADAVAAGHAVSQRPTWHSPNHTADTPRDLPGPSLGPLFTDMVRERPRSQTSADRVRPGTWNVVPKGVSFSSQQSLQTSRTGAFCQQAPPQGSISPSADGETSPANTEPSISSGRDTHSSHASPATPSLVPTCVKATRTTRPPPFKYALTIRQQPIAARACGQGERDRRTIDPPPILQLRIVHEATSVPATDPNGLLALTCTLVRVSEDGREVLDSVNASDSTRRTVPVRKLMGATVASPYSGKDEYGRAGTFFVLSDLSCRDPGDHKLRFSLVRLDPKMMTTGTRHPTVATIESDTFIVYVAKYFPGMRPSTELLKALRAQGLNVPLKKGKDATGRNGYGGRNDDDDDDDDDDDGDDGDDESECSEDGGRGNAIQGNGRKRRRKKRRVVRGG